MGKDIEYIVNSNDWFLQSAIKVVNDSNTLTYGLTIITHGFIVSGECISGKSYFEEYGNEMASAVDEQELKNTFKNHFSKIGKQIYENQDSSKPPEFIHFKNAKFFQSNGVKPIPTNRGVLWRGRISEISGFSLGILNAD